MQPIPCELDCPLHTVQREWVQYGRAKVNYVTSLKLILKRKKTEVTSQPQDQNGEDDPDEPDVERTTARQHD